MEEWIDRIACVRAFAAAARQRPCECDVGPLHAAGGYGVPPCLRLEVRQADATQAPTNLGLGRPRFFFPSIFNGLPKSKKLVTHSNILSIFISNITTGPIYQPLLSFFPLLFYCPTNQHLGEDDAEATSGGTEAGMAAQE